MCMKKICREWVGIIGLMSGSSCGAILPLTQLAGRCLIMLSGQNWLMAQIKPGVHHAAPTQEKEGVLNCVLWRLQADCLTPWVLEKGWRQRGEGCGADTEKGRWSWLLPSTVCSPCLCFSISYSFSEKRHCVDSLLGKYQNKDKPCFAHNLTLVCMNIYVWHSWACTASVSVKAVMGGRSLTSS